MGHSQEEECTLFKITLQYLYEINYSPTERDYQFLRDNSRRLFTDDIRGFVQRFNERPI